jgi:DNA-binding NarL/FixJ family response regulator
MEGRSGIELVRDLKERKADLPVLVLSIHRAEHYVERALEAGARGYITKTEAPKLMISAIRKALAGEIFLCEGMTTRVLTSFVTRPPSPGRKGPVACLSNRELEVFEMIGRGQGTKQIAEMLSLSINTIGSHRRNIKRKLNIDTAPELAKFAAEWLLDGR